MSFWFKVFLVVSTAIITLLALAILPVKPFMPRPILLWTLTLLLILAAASLIFDIAEERKREVRSRRSEEERFVEVE